MENRLIALSILVLFGLFCAATVAIVSWLSGAKAATAFVAGGTTFGGTLAIGLATLAFVFDR